MGLISSLFTSQLRMKLAELQHQHTLTINEMQAKIDIEKRHWEEDRTRLISQLKKEHDLKLTEAVTLTKLDGQQKTAQAQLDADKKLNERVKQLTEENYRALSTAMTKLHEEGNVQTKFTQELALKMLESIPTGKSETKVLTGTVDIKT